MKYYNDENNGDVFNKNNKVPSSDNDDNVSIIKSVYERERIDFIIMMVGSIGINHHHHRHQSLSINHYQSFIINHYQSLSSSINIQC